MMETDLREFATKKEARVFARSMRNQWAPTTLADWSEAITYHLLRMCLFQDARTLLCYVGARPGELDTRPLIAEALRNCQQVVVPVTQKEGKMAWSRLARLDDLEMTSLGLLEPRPQAIDLVEDPGGLCIVPGMLFQKDGHRLGFGGGYYDRFLARRSGPTIALTPSACLGHRFPIEEHDQAVGHIVTESGVVAAEPLSVE